jgi:hypothetical protein
VIAQVLGWNPSPLAALEWQHLHARRPLPIGASLAWAGVALYAVLMAQPWAMEPITPAALHGLLAASPALAPLFAPTLWVQAFAFWLLPWALLERCMRHRGNSWEQLEAKVTTLIRLYAWALAFYPLLRLGAFGILRLVQRGPAAPTLIDFILFDQKQPIALRYFAALGVAGLYGAVTWTLVVSRLRIAQWAAMSTPGRGQRFIAYAATTLVFGAFFLLVKANLFNAVSDPVRMIERGKVAYLAAHWVPWTIIAMTLSIGIAVGAHHAARRRMGLF